MRIPISMCACIFTFTMRHFLLFASNHSLVMAPCLSIMRQQEDENEDIAIVMHYYLRVRKKQQMVDA